MPVPSTHCEAKKHGYRQTQDGIVVSFVLHPNEVPDDLALAALGTRYMLALVRIGDDEQPQAPEAKRPARPFASLPRSQQAGILCGDKTFRRWAMPSGSEPNDAEARQFVLNICKVNSRRELDVSNDAGVLWDALRGQFEIAAGRATEARE
jgi:hypothetical protein